MTPSHVQIFEVSCFGPLFDARFEEALSGLLLGSETTNDYDIPTRFHRWFDVDVLGGMDSSLGGGLLRTIDCHRDDRLPGD